jgi:thiol-disulfide isomerase/thioredoxin
MPMIRRKKEQQKVPAVPEANEIHWITSIDELQAKMRKSPKKVIIDMYTGWCGWCKRMDAVTYTNPSLIKYVNNNFYAVKFDAERQDTIRFQDKLYFFYPEYKANGFAIELMKSSMSYPTTDVYAREFSVTHTYTGLLRRKGYGALPHLFRRQRIPPHGLSKTTRKTFTPAGTMASQLRPPATCSARPLKKESHTLPLPAKEGQLILTVNPTRGLSPFRGLG